MPDHKSEIEDFLRPLFVGTNHFLERFPIDEGHGVLSLADHGLPWVQSVVELAFPTAPIVPPVVASSLFGAYFEEFDRWRAAARLTDQTSFQTVFVDAHSVGAASLHLANRDALVGWYGRPYDGNHVSILCVDCTFIRRATDALYNIVVDWHSPSQACLKAWAESQVGIDKKSVLNPSDSEIRAIDLAREAFRESAAALIDEPWTASSARELLALATKEQDRGELDHQAWRYCESTILHFLLGHEFGHYCYRAGGERSFEGTRSFAMLLVPSANAGEGLVEEIFCDVMAMENCVFQMSYFDVPPVFTIFAALWVLQFVEQSLAAAGAGTANSPTTLKEVQCRQKALLTYWRARPGLVKNAALAECARRADSSLRDVASLVAQRVDAVA